MEVDSRFLVSSPALISNFVLELTDKCNLRCVYCHQNRPDFIAKRNMTDKMVMRVMEYFQAAKPPFINLTGGGDLIMQPGWAEQCERMLQFGIPLRATVNLGKILTPAECEVFAKFSGLTVSIDTVDGKLLKEYRKAVDIRTITQNIVMIKSAAQRLGIPGPEWMISAVYYAEIAEGLPDVAAYAAAIGAVMFGMQDLLEYERIQDNVTPVWKLTGDAALRAVAATRKSITFAQQKGMSLSLPGDFMSRLDHFEKLNHVAAAA